MDKRTAKSKIGMLGEKKEITGRMDLYLMISDNPNINTNTFGSSYLTMLTFIGDAQTHIIFERTVIFGIGSLLVMVGKRLNRNDGKKKMGELFNIITLAENTGSEKDKDRTFMGVFLL